MSTAKELGERIETLVFKDQREERDALIDQLVSLAPAETAAGVLTHEPTDAQVALLDPWMRPEAARELLRKVLASSPQPPATHKGAMPDVVSPLVNETCWKLIEALPEGLSAHNWNNLKPAMYAALKHFHAGLTGIPKESEHG